MEYYVPITLDNLIDDINNSSLNDYIFLRILNKEDRAKFLANISTEYYNEIFETKKIRLFLWINIMKSIKLSINYIIYRRGYEGENRGKRYINTQMTNYVVRLWTLNAYEQIDNNKTFFEKIKEDIKKIIYGDTQPIIQILLKDGKMEKFDFKTSKYTLSSWENHDYKIKNDLY